MKPIIYLDMDGVLADFHTAAIRAHLRQGPLKLSHGTYYNTDDDQLISSPERWPKGISLMKYLGIKTIADFWAPINSDPLFWRGISNYTWCFDLVNQLVKFDSHVVLCTSPSQHHTSWGGKALWLQIRGLHQLPAIMMTPAGTETPKGEVIGKWMLAGPGRILIDDWEQQTNSFTAAGGKSILFPQPWNENHPYMDNPVQYTLNQLDTILKGIK